MVKAIVGMADRVLGRVLREESAEAYCACPAGGSSWCSGSTLYVRVCCSWNCAVAPSCVTKSYPGDC
ncbi:hypothetical protein ACVW0K_003937 [Streptomyces filamentosus]|uniref:Uncharacterized protein n=2 Tax=Streptomyces TaxID=1883 RepID=A0A919EK77_STRFL|nr:hypothetical protein GCM10017667_20910 [Streptomyces filamentosus]